MESKYKQLKIRCPCCGQQVNIQIDEDTGEISSVSFCVNEKGLFKDIDLG